MSRLKPLEHELEFSVFGPGIGESILIHLGQNEWVVVDSCLDPATRRPAAISYLENINIDPSRAIKYIIASHWHDDHIKGISDIFEICDEAEFIFSDALQINQFFELTEFSSDPTRKKLTSGIDEFKKVIDIKKSREKKVGRGLFKSVDEGQLIFRKEFNGNFPAVEMIALSPSSRAKIETQKKISQLIPKEKESKKRFIDTGPNHSAVVLWIEFGSICMLVGSDLQNSSDPLMGWNGVINSSVRSQRKAHIFKIPHHGSENGHNNSVWELMIEKNSIALITPFTPSKIPRNTDKKRICSFTPKSFLSSSPSNSGSRSRTVEKIISETFKLYSQKEQNQIRVRSTDVPGQFDIKLFNSARGICA